MFGVLQSQWLSEDDDFDQEEYFRGHKEMPLGLQATSMPRKYFRGPRSFI